MDWIKIEIIPSFLLGKSNKIISFPPIKPYAIIKQNVMIHNAEVRITTKIIRFEFFKLELIF
jgi:NDP-sugar pyrophosphorylase family protein